MTWWNVVECGGCGCEFCSLLKKQEEQKPGDARLILMSNHVTLK
jgi:hypothetical protein